MKNEVMGTVATNGWDFAITLLDKVPVETIVKNAPLIIVVGGISYIVTNRYKYQLLEATQAMENGYNYSNGNISFTKESVLVS